MRVGRPARPFIVCVAGMPGSGKDEAVGVATEAGFAVVRMGDVVRDEAKRRGVPLDDRSVGGMAHQERVEYGFGIWAERTLPRLHGERILVEGLRGKAELDVFRRKYGNRLVVLAIHASPGTRYRRVAHRARADVTWSFTAFTTRDERELGWGLGDVLATAEIHIVNEGPVGAFRDALRAAFRRIKRGAA